MLFIPCFLINFQSLVDILILDFEDIRYIFSVLNPQNKLYLHVLVEFLTIHLVRFSVVIISQCLLIVDLK